MDIDTLNHLIDLMDQLQINRIPGIEESTPIDRSSLIRPTIDDLYQLKLEKD